MFVLLPVLLVATCTAIEDVCDMSESDSCHVTKGTGLIQKKGEVHKHTYKENFKRSPISKPPPPPKPDPPPRPDSDSRPSSGSGPSSVPAPPTKPTHPGALPENFTFAIGTTGLPCTVFDDCKDTGTVTGDRPHCVCSNGCHWGVDCGRDAVVLASEIFVPDNHCAADGSCEPGKPLMIGGKLVQEKPQRLCYTYNNGQFIPENSADGYCMGIRTKSYADFCIAVVPNTEGDFAAAMRWSNAQLNSDQQVECSIDSFCKAHGKASGTLGNCDCELPDAELIDNAGDFDHYAEIYQAECTSELFCNGKGTANFVADDTGGGACTCSCSSEYSGHHCELSAGEPCTDREDCSGHGIASGIRPHCKCENCMKFSGDKCDVWEWYGNIGVFEG